MMSLPSIDRKAAAGLLGVLCEDELEYCCWAETFANSAGPFGGPGGQMMTTIQMEAWNNFGTALVFSGGRVVGIRPFSIRAEWGRKARV